MSSFVSGLAFLALLTASVCATAGQVDLRTIKPGDRAHQFEVVSVYVGVKDRPMGARFVHKPTGFKLDLLQIESVPQALTCVNSLPDSDQGEPHTQEHLLLLRGSVGRTLTNKQAMSMVTHSAYTEAWRTCYAFNTGAGTEAFFDVFAQQQRALLRPDYSDAEIRLEVRNFGVTKSGDGQLRLEEKGTVYNEMVSTSQSASRRAEIAKFHALYGIGHPLSFEHGGTPEGLRRLKPEDIRKFHKATYHLGNMGTVAAFPRSEAIGDLLRRFDRILSVDAPAGGSASRRRQSIADVPRARGDAEGSIRLYEYPSFNAEQPSLVSIVWPADRRLDAAEQVLAELFFGAVAGGDSSRMHELLIDGAKRKVDIGAGAVAATVGDWGGHPVSISLSGVRPSAMTDDGLKFVRAVVVDELQRIAAWPDGSDELKAFNALVASRAAERERQAVMFMGTPPGFGEQETESAWLDLLTRLERSPGNRKSLVMQREFDGARGLVASQKNVWRDLLAKWKITGVQPYVTGAKPNPGLIAREHAEREARLLEETERVRKRYGEEDAQKALVRFEADAKAELARIELASKAPQSAFVAKPPMTLDDGLQFETIKMAKGVPLVASRFDSMTGAMVGVALRADGLPRGDLLYLSLMPELLTNVGVIEKGQPVAFDQMSDRLRREVVGLNASFSTNVRTGRVELVVRGAGVGAEESRRAVEWMNAVLHTPDWRIENLARIRDVVDQALGELRNTMQRPEDAWVRDPANAWVQQRNAAWLASSSFMTRANNALHLRWMLKDVQAGDGPALAEFLTGLAKVGRGLNRTGLKEILIPGMAPGWDALTGRQRELMKEALRDLELCLADMPDESIGEDFGALAGGLRDDLATGPGQALAKMESVRQRLMSAAGARLFMSSPSDLRPEVLPGLQAIVERLGSTEFVAQVPLVEGLIRARVKSRGGDSSAMHVGLLAPSKQGGVIMTAMPSVHFGDSAKREKQLEFLASMLYAGSGAHGAFARTIGVGLAYSNGISGRVSQGRVTYYAERTPELPQTVRFVVDLIKSGKPDPALKEYVMAMAFGGNRSSDSYESRAEGIAADVADGQPPEMVRRFRGSLLELRKDPRLVEKVFARKDRVHAMLLPGYERGGLVRDGGTYFVIGPERQLKAWEEYLQESTSLVADGQKLQRLYARDFWMR